MKTVVCPTVVCPKCGYTTTEDKFDVAIRQETKPEAHHICVGYSCPSCKHEWGFE